MYIDGLIFTKNWPVASYFILSYLGKFAVIVKSAEREAGSSLPQPSPLTPPFPLLSPSSLNPCLYLSLSLSLSLSRVSEDTDCGSKPKVRRTRAERAKQDALNSFGGFGFDDVMATSRKRIARTFEMPKEKRGEGEGEAEEAEGEAREGEGDGDSNQEREEEKENLEVVAET